MEKRLRVALLGGGKMATQHAAAIHHCAAAELVAVVDPAVPASDLQAKFGAGVAPYSDHEVMLHEVRPDVVHIITPPRTHVSLARACLEAGSHVYVEKPFALTTSDAEFVVQLAESKGLQACAGHQVQFQDSAREYRRYLPLIGEIRHVESFFSFNPVRRRAGGGGLTTPVEQLIDILPHPVYLLLSALPPDGPAQLSALDVSPEGEVRAVVRRGAALATLVVSLRARPIESYLRVMGANGSVEADFVIGYLVRHPGPGASAPSVILRPFSKAWQTGWGSFKGLLRLFFRQHKSYPGLAELLSHFYASISAGTAPPITALEITDTVRLCEGISARLAAAEQAAEVRALADLREREAVMSELPSSRSTVLLTGGTGLLGRSTALALQKAGWRVRVPVRRELLARERLPGVEYVRVDLGVEVPDSLLDGVDLVVHAAAETAGDKADHERNTIRATENLLAAMVRTGTRHVINISSVAVLKPSTSGSVLREDSPVDLNNLARGPYVWAKATAEMAAVTRAKSGEIDVRTIRLGPLVDYDSFTPPGRLGREVARLFVAMGRPAGPLSICSVATAARVITNYAEDFEAAPPIVNLLEVPAPTRGQLVGRLRQARPDLKFLWMPFPVLWSLSAAFKLAMRAMRPTAAPLDLYAAFKSEKYYQEISTRVTGGSNV